MVDEKKPEGDKDTANNFFSSLQIASSILRNSELIDDAELKNTAYSKLVRYWCEILLGVIAAVESGFDDDKQIDIKETIPSMPDDFGKYMMKMLIPNAIFAMARESLGTSKLELMIKRDVDLSMETVCKLFSTVLYADLGLSNRLILLKQLTDKSNASRFLIELVFFKLLHIYMLGKISRHEEEQIKPMLADLFARLSNSTNIKSQHGTDIVKSNFIRNLDRDKLMKKLSAGKDD